MNSMYSLDSDKKKENKSTGYIIAAGAAILIAIAAIWGNNLSGTKKSVVAELSDKLAEDRNVLRNDIILHSHFQKLQDLDEQYNVLVTRSPSPAELDKAGYAITKEENALKAALDSITAESEKYNVWANVVLSDSITTSFRKALANRKYMATIRSVIEGKPIDIRKDDKQVLEMQFDLQKKDDRIATLEKQLKEKSDIAPQQAVETKAAPVNKPELTKQNEDLTANLKDEEMRNTGLLEVTRTLKSDNEKLLAELNKVKRTNTSDDAAEQAVRNKVSSLQEQIDEMGAELNFAKVDCNLSRADAKKIISNSRQRKELLADALQTLQSLTRSDNSNVQKRAKEKLSELNQIASTVRD